MTISVKLDRCTFYVKIRIWPCLDRINSLGRKGCRNLFWFVWTSLCLWQKIRQSFSCRAFNDYQTLKNRWRKSFIFQLRFSAFRAGANGCDIVVCRVFDDVPQNDLNKHNEHEASSTSPALTATYSASTPPHPHNDISPASMMPQQSTTMMTTSTQPITCPPGFLVEMKRRLHFDSDATLSRWGSLFSLTSNPPYAWSIVPYF